MSSQMRWQRITALLVSLLLVFVFSYFTCAGGVADMPLPGGTFVEGIVGTPFMPNPLFAEYNEPDRDLIALLFSGLTRPNSQGEPSPDLADRWEISPDGRVYVFQLRPGVFWHDGEPFTARDVVFTVKLIQNPDYPGSPILPAVFRDVLVERLDDLTVRFTLPQPFAPFLSYLELGVLPAHRLQGTPVRDLPASPFKSRPVGTGPFRLREVALDRVLLEPHPDYHRGRPYLKEIELRFFPDYTSALAALKSGEVQALSSIAPADAVDLQTSPNPRLHTAPRTNSTMVFLNTRSPLFAERAVRQALLYGLDRARIVEVAARGFARPADGPFAPGTWGHARVDLRYEHDPERARALLDAAGWVVGTDGLRTQASGSAGREPLRLSFILLTNDDPVRVAVAQEVSRQWAKLGVKAEISSTTSTDLVRNVLLPRRFTAALYGLDLGVDPDPFAVWHSSQTKGEGLNLAGYSSPEADRLIEQGRQTTDPAERRRLYQQFQSLFLQDLPSLPLYHPVYVYAVDSSIKGIELRPIDQPASRFADVQHWHIRTKRILVDW